MGSLGSIISAFIKYSLWTSTSQAAMQHSIEHIIPTPILIRVTCCCVAFLEQNKNDIMKRIEDLRANKLFKGMWTLLPMPKSKLLVCSKKKVFPVAATKLQPKKVVQIGIKEKRLFTSLTCSTVQRWPQFSCSSGLLEGVRSSIIAALSNHLCST